MCLGDKYKEESDNAQPNHTDSRLKMYYSSKKLYSIDFTKTFYYLGKPKERKDKLENYRRDIDFHAFTKKYAGSSKYASTITTKQDRRPNAGVIDYETKNNFFRFLTPRECFLLMGFKEDDYEKLNYQVKHTENQYTLAGNSIVVIMLEYVFTIMTG